MAIGLLGTLDTKGLEIAFLKRLLEEQGESTVVVDIGLSEPQGIAPDIPRQEVAAAAGAVVTSLLGGSRQEAMNAMGQGARKILQRLHADGRLEGVLGVGGNQGTAIACIASGKCE